jgi:hypothetical protein
MRDYIDSSFIGNLNPVLVSKGIELKYMIILSFCTTIQKDKAIFVFRYKHNDFMLDETCAFKIGGKKIEAVE